MVSVLLLLSLSLLMQCGNDENQHNFPRLDHFHDGDGLASHGCGFRHGLRTGVKWRAQHVQSLAGPEMVLVLTIESRDERPGVEDVFHGRFLFQLSR